MRRQLACIASVIVGLASFFAAEGGTGAVHRVERMVPSLAASIDAVRPARGIDLVLARCYPVSPAAQDRKGVFGCGWIDNLTVRAERRYPDGLDVQLPSGRALAFRDVKGKWQCANPYGTLRLEERSAAYVLTFEDGTVQAFDKESGHTSYVKDNKGNSLTFTWDRDRLLRVVHTDGQCLSFMYRDGLMSSMADDCGRMTEYSYTDGYLSSAKTYDGLTTRYEYETVGTNSMRSLTKIVRPDGTTREFLYDADGCISSMTENGGKRQIKLEHLADGVIVVTAPDGGRSKLEFGDADEPLQMTDALGNMVRYEYAANGLLEAVVSPSGKRVAIGYGEHGRIQSVSLPSGASTKFAYAGEFGNLARVTDARAQSVSFDFDTAGRITSAIFPDGTASKVSYNGRGDVERLANRRGAIVERLYDVHGRIVRQSWPNGRIFTYAYDRRGNVVRATDSETGAVLMSYDIADRLTKIEYPEGRGFDFKYDAVGRLVSRVASDGFEERFSYDAEGRLASVADKEGNAFLSNEYDSQTGRIAKHTYGNGTSVKYAYDLLGRITSIIHLDAGGKEMEKFAYTYDADGKCQAALSKSGWETYAYDADGQLTAAFYPDGTKDAFSYDSVGNRTAANGTSSRVNALNEYTSVGEGKDAVSFAYDLDGNLVSQTSASGATAYYYDVLNRLVAVTNEAAGVRWSCKYDALGNRISVTDNGVTTKRVLHLGLLPSVAAEYVDGKLARRRIVVGALQIAEIASDGTLLYFHGDIIGSVRLATGGDGKIVDCRAYKAFGEMRTGGPTSVSATAGYVGMLGVETDPTGLLFMRNRYYLPALGRFITPDPIGFNGGDVNWYRYCGNNPVVNVDVEGLSSLSQNVVKIIGGVACVGVGFVMGASAPAAGPAAPVAIAGAYESVGLGGLLIYDGFNDIVKQDPVLRWGVNVIKNFGVGMAKSAWNYMKNPFPNKEGVPESLIWTDEDGTAHYEKSLDSANLFAPAPDSESESKRPKSKKEINSAKQRNSPRPNRKQRSDKDAEAGKDKERELSPDEIPDPDNDDYVWCEDVCGDEGLKPVCPKDTENTVYWGCSRCGHVIRKKARKAKRFERALKAQGKEGYWHGTQFAIRQAKSVEERGKDD